MSYTASSRVVLHHLYAFLVSHQNHFILFEWQQHVHSYCPKRIKSKQARNIVLSFSYWCVQIFHSSPFNGQYGTCNDQLRYSPALMGLKLYLLFDTVTNLHMSSRVSSGSKVSSCFKTLALERVSMAECMIGSQTSSMFGITNIFCVW